MTYEELKINLDLYDPEDILSSVGKQWNGCWFVVCDEGDCHLFKDNGEEDDIRKVDRICNSMILPYIKKIIIPEGVTIISRDTFWGSGGLINVTIPDSVTSIGASAFRGCCNLKHVKIPDSVKYIGSNTFLNCYNLTSVILSNNVTVIESYMFAGCHSLTDITISNNVKRIEYCAFYDCWKLKHLTIPANVREIEYGISYCDKLENLTFIGKTIDEVKAMKNYPFGIKDKSIIKCI